MKKRLGAFIAALFMMACLFANTSLTALAATGSVSVSSASAEVGDDVSVSVTVSADASLGSAKICVTYDPNVLRYNSSSGSLGSGVGGSGGITFVWYAGGNGTGSVSAELNFTAIGSGNSAVSISNADVVTFDEESQVNVSIGNGSVSVSGGDASENGDDISESDETETTPDVNSDITVELDGTTYYIVSELNPDTIPLGFEAVSYSYGDNQIEAAKAIQADIYLIRLADENGENGKYYIYGESDGSFTPVVKILDKYVVVPLGDASLIPQGYSETVINVNQVTDEETGEVTSDAIQAWIAADSTDFALVYVVGPSGAAGLYRYDSSELTMQRYVREETGNVQTEESETEVYAEEEGHFPDKASLIFAAAIAVLIVIVIILFISNGNKKKRIAALMENRRMAESEISRESKHCDRDILDDNGDDDSDDGHNDRDHSDEKNVMEKTEKKKEASAKSKMSSSKNTAISEKASEYNVPDKIGRSKGFMHELEQMEQRLMNDKDME